MAEAEPSTSAAVPSKSIELSQNTDKIASTPFNDPIQRTNCLIQYIRIRKQKTKKEIAERNALRKQRIDAEVTLKTAVVNLQVFNLN